MLPRGDLLIGPLAGAACEDLPLEDGLLFVLLVDGMDGRKMEKSAQQFVAKVKNCNCDYVHFSGFGSCLAKSISTSQLPIY